MPDSSILRLGETLWEIPVTYKQGMRVPARIFATSTLFEKLDAAVFDQITNVATLPGVVGHVFCMPDGHSGYGFPIGGVAAMDARTGVISPGGIGFDINCGMRLVNTNFTEQEIQPKLQQIVDKLFARIPAGVGGHGNLKLTDSDFRRAVEQGSKWCLKNGYATEEDLELTEDGGCIPGADVREVSAAAVERGLNQIGTLGSGNHYLEIQIARPENIRNPKLAALCGIHLPNQVVIMFHTGSRGFGHQVASDYLRIFLGVMEKKYGITVTDRELACTPFDSPEGQAYFKAMKCAINMAFMNRQVILHRIREVFSDVFKKSPEDLGLKTIYDVAHNTAKLETHRINERDRELIVHRKGATRAFGPLMQGIPAKYRSFGQPVIIGGSMESGSYLLFGTEKGAEGFFSTAHGSGRTMSRSKAKQVWHGKQLAEDMKKRGMVLRTNSYAGLAEEAGGAYKDIDEVIKATELSGLSTPVVRLVPIGNIKG